MELELHGKYVLCIYKEGNMSRAAKKLGISQPALSMAIGNLEKKLGYKIFDKNDLIFEENLYIMEEVKSNLITDKLKNILKKW